MYSKARSGKTVEQYCSFLKYTQLYIQAGGIDKRGYLRRELTQHDFCLGWLEQI
jgi:hypothetical protein